MYPWNFRGCFTTIRAGFGGGFPGLLRLDHHAGDGVDDDDRGVGHLEGGARIGIGQAGASASSPSSDSVW